MNTEEARHNTRLRVGSTNRLGGSGQSLPIDLLWGLLGALIGGVLGYFLVFVIARQGLYAIFIGMGCGALSGRKSVPLGIICGVLGLAVGIYIARQGLCEIILPGTLLGMGCGALSGRKSVTLGIICGVLGLAVGIYTRWRLAPFITDESFSFYLSHLLDVDRVSQLMILVGTAFAFAFGMGREGGVWIRKRNTENPIERIQECLAGILAIAVLIFCGSVISFLASPFADPSWAMLGFTKRFGMRFSLWILGGSTIVIVVVLTLAYNWARTKGISDGRVLEGGLAPTFVIAVLMISGLVISFLTCGGKQWAIMGLTKRLGMQRSLWLIGASIGSMIICIIIVVIYGLLANRLRDRLEKTKKD